MPVIEVWKACSIHLPEEVRAFYEEHYREADLMPQSTGHRSRG